MEGFQTLFLSIHTPLLLLSSTPHPDYCKETGRSLLGRREGNGLKQSVSANVYSGCSFGDCPFDEIPKTAFIYKKDRKHFFMFSN